MTPKTTPSQRRGIIRTALGHRLADALISHGWIGYSINFGEDDELIGRSRTALRNAVVEAFCAGDNFLLTVQKQPTGKHWIKILPCEGYDDPANCIPDWSTLLSGPCPLEPAIDAFIDSGTSAPAQAGDNK